MSLKPVPHVQMNPMQRMRFFVNMASDFLTAQERLFDEYGDIYAYTIMGQTYYPVRDPRHVQDVLVRRHKALVKDTDFNNPQRGLSKFIGSGLLTSTGDYWKRQRKLAAPAFHAQRVSEYAEVITHYGQEMIDTWRDGQQLKMVPQLSEATHKIINRTMFADLAPEVTWDVVRDILEIQKTYLRSMMLPDMLVSPLVDQFSEIMARFDASIYPVIQAYRAAGEDRGDLLSMLILTEDVNGEGMTDEQVRDEAISLILAGHETTASTLAWTTMLVAQHPQVRDRLYDEIDEVLAGRTPTLADLRALPYTTMVLKESQRLYPAAPILLRAVREDVQVGGYHIPAGGVIVVSPYFTQRHPGLWDDPTAFRPSRFSPENETEIDKWAYFPFGGGPRVCLGQSFAQMEAQLLLAMIFSNYDLQVVNGYRPNPEIAVTMSPHDGLPVRVARRRATCRLTVIA